MVTLKCSICGRKLSDLIEWHNPFPMFSVDGIHENKNAVCCDSCYYRYVVPARTSADVLKDIRYSIGESGRREVIGA